MSTAETAALLLECEALRRRTREQELELSELRDTTGKLRREAEELRTDRDFLSERVRDLQAVSPSSFRGRDGGSSPGSEEPGSPEWLTRRVADLECENRAFRAESRSAEERMVELVSLVRAAIDDDPRPSSPTTPAKGSPTSSRAARGERARAAREVSPVGSSSTARRDEQAPRPEDAATAPTRAPPPPDPGGGGALGGPGGGGGGSRSATPRPAPGTSGGAGGTSTPRSATPRTAPGASGGAAGGSSTPRSATPRTAPGESGGAGGSSTPRSGSITRIRRVVTAQKPQARGTNEASREGRGSFLSDSD